MKTFTLRNAAFALLCFAATTATAQQSLPYRDESLPIDRRVDDLASRLTLEEKVSLMMHGAPKVERLGIPAYNWWNECLHGIGRSAYKVTVFPQPIGMAATFNPAELQKSAEMISDEGRAVYNLSVKKGTTANRYTGLTFWTPNINIFRDPRWGRGHETYGEDPHLTAEMGLAMVRGLQGDHPRYLKLSACAKHFAVHSGPEPLRHGFEAVADDHDLFDTYLPAFYRLVTEGKVTSVMCAYNSFRGQPCCGSNLFLRKLLINDWKFDGYVTSDCGAIRDFVSGHKTHKDGATAAADAVLHGTDLNCGGTYQSLVKAVEQGLITEEQVNISLKKLLKIQFRLGMFDSPASVPWSKFGQEMLETEAHKQQALKMAHESMVLLKNEKNLLPLSAKKYKKIAVLGPNADNGTTQLGNYNGFPTKNVTLLEALRAEKGVEVVHESLTDFTKLNKGVELSSLAAKYKDCDLIIFAGGISPTLEGEEGDAGGIEGFQGGDRLSINLPTVQTRVMQELKKTGKPVVFVCMSGSAIAFNWEAENLPVVLQAWYGGQAAGTALADILFGRYNPSGKLPLTFYRSDADLPAHTDYSMKNRTYRYFGGDVLYPFGYGLSYTTFKYGKLQVAPVAQTGDSVTVSVEVRNAGKRAGEEAVQLYLSHKAIDPVAPNCQLAAFQKVSLKPGERKVVTFRLSPRTLAYVEKEGGITQAPGTVKLSVGGVCPSAPERFTKGVLSATFELKGEPQYFMF